MASELGTIVDCKLGPDDTPAGPVCLLGGGGGGGPSLFMLWALAGSACKLIWPTLAGSEAGSNGSGSFLGAALVVEPDRMVEWLICSYGELEMLEKEESLELARGTATQSGSSVDGNGFDGRLGLRTMTPLSWPGFGPRGGPAVDLAAFPFSSHHLC